MPLLPSLSSAFLLSTRPWPDGSVLCRSGENRSLRMIVPVYLPVTLTCFERRPVTRVRRVDVRLREAGDALVGVLDVLRGDLAVARRGTGTPSLSLKLNRSPFFDAVEGLGEAIHDVERAGLERRGDPLGCSRSRPRLPRSGRTPDRDSRCRSRGGSAECLHHLPQCAVSSANAAGVRPSANAVAAAPVRPSAAARASSDCRSN